MSHWVGWKDLTAEKVDSIKALLPAFFEEMGSTGTLTDAVMQSMQPYFDVDFHHYAVDRAHLTTSRQRAQLMTVYQRTLRRHSVQLASVALQQDGAEDTRPDPAWKKDKKGLAVCQCGGRHYEDNDDAWAKHKTYKKHKDWRLIQLGREAEINIASHAFRPAGEHEWFNQYSTMALKRFADQAQLSFAVVKHFSSRRIIDDDLPWIARFPTQRMTADFGLSVGQASMFREFAVSAARRRGAIDE
jgi:hypothetical protein